MNIACISGSQRPGSETIRVVEYIAKVLNQKQATTQIRDLGTQHLPLKMSSEARNENGKEKVSEFQEMIAWADGYIIATPEWGGSATPEIQDALQHMGNLASHKPAVLVAVSAGRGGAYPIPQLRGFGYKNNKIVFLPDHLIVRKVESVLQDTDEELNKEDSYIRARIDWTLDILLAYTTTLKNLREQYLDLLTNPEYPNGM